MSTEAHLHKLMKRYTVEHLVGITPEEFKTKIDGFLNIKDMQMEGYKSEEMQRDLSVKFHWGHNHDFGDFKLEGRMGNRHIAVMKTFIDRFGLPVELEGKRILDIGPWTGGTSLLLAAMGASVETIEEVQKYSWVIRFLAKSFNAKIKSYPFSLYYAWDKHTRFDCFDYVIFAGVLYHLTDPVLALRIIFNCLKDGGKAFIETAHHNCDKPTFYYTGPSRDGWNWLIPSLSALTQMLKDVGFVDVRAFAPNEKRAYAVATKKKHKDILRAGLSRSSIR